MNWNETLKPALEAVEQACDVAARVQAGISDADTATKGDRSPVTIADYAVQALINTRLNQAFPQIPIIGEEDSTELRETPHLLEKIEAVLTPVDPSLSGYEICTAIDLGRSRGGPSGTYWTLDPIDGTKGFIDKRQYAIALALIHDGEVVLGVLGCPNMEPTGCIAYTVRGEGARQKLLSSGEVTEIRVDAIQATSEARFCESVESGHTSHGRSARIAEELGIHREPVRMDSQAKYIAIARGDASIYLRLPTSASYREKIWDHAAGKMIVEEAGGRVSDVHGAALDFSHGHRLEQNQGVIATNGQIHDKVTGVVKAILAQDR